MTASRAPKDRQVLLRIPPIGVNPIGTARWNDDGAVHERWRTAIPKPARIPAPPRLQRQRLQTLLASRGMRSPLQVVLHFSRNPPQSADCLSAGSSRRDVLASGAMLVLGSFVVPPEIALADEVDAPAMTPLQSLKRIQSHENQSQRCDPF